MGSVTSHQLRLHCVTDYCRLNNVSCICPQGVLRIHFLEALDLEGKDKFLGGLIKGKSDPYGVLQIGNQLFQSKTVKESLHPKWNEVYEVRGVSWCMSWSFITAQPEPHCQHGVPTCIWWSVYLLAVPWTSISMSFSPSGISVWALRAAPWNRALWWGSRQRRFPGKVSLLSHFIRSEVPLCLCNVTDM